MPFDDVLKALDAFTSGVQQFAIGQATNDAIGKLNELNNQNLSDRERLMANSRVSNELALRLTGLNAAPHVTEQAVAGLRPSASEMEQSLSNREMEATKLGSTAASSPFNIEKMKAEAAYRQELMKMQMLTGKAGIKNVNDAVKGFQTLPNMQAPLKALPTLEDNVRKMDENMGKYGSTAITNLVKFGILRAEVGRINERELQGANESPSLKAELEKKIGTQIEGEVPTNIQEFWKKIAQQSLDNTKAYVSQGIDSYSKGHPVVPEDVLNARLRNTFNVQKPTEPPVLAEMKAWAADPKNQSNPNYQRTLNEIKRLQGRP